MGMRRRIEVKVNAALEQASHTMSVAEREMLRASAKFNALLDEVIDGFEVSLVRRPGATIMDFIKGVATANELPLGVRIDLLEGDEKE